MKIEKQQSSKIVKIIYYIYVSTFDNIFNKRNFPYLYVYSHPGLDGILSFF